jgi:hypothetical protein
LHLLKSGSKPLGAIRKKKKYDAKGDLAQYKEAKRLQGDIVDSVAQSAQHAQESNYSQSQSQIDGDMK